MSTMNLACVSPEKQQAVTEAKQKSLCPKMGDFVRCCDLERGKANGQELVGKISYVATKMGSDDWIWIRHPWALDAWSALVF
jgi:hypothetical protein